MGVKMNLKLTPKMKPISRISRISTVVAILISLCIVSCCLNRELYVHTQFIEPRNMVFAYSIDLASIGITPKHINLLDRSRVMVVGNIGNVNGVAVLEVSNPYRDPIVEDIYPLTGSPTCTAKDGYPTTRIAVGSDRGEILVFRVDGGRITKYLYIVLGADFYVNKIFLAKDSVGNVKILALVSEGGASVAPCMNCHLYILDEEAQGVFRIGPKVGNATALGRAYEGVYIQDVAPLAIYGDDGFYWDASKVLLAYIPQKDVVRFVLNVTYMYEGKVEAISKALVEVNATVRGLTSMVYGVNANDRGVAYIPVQVDSQRPTYITFVIRNIAGEIVWTYKFIYEPNRYRILPEEIPVPPAILPTSHVDTRPAEKVYGIPGFLRVNLMLVDTTPAPISMGRNMSATFLLDPPLHGLFFIRGSKEAMSKLVYGSPGYIYVSTVAIETDRIRNIVTVEDYVGIGTTIISDASTYSDGSYIMVGLSDGRLRVYLPQAGGGFTLKYIYTLLPSIRSITTIPTASGYTYVVVSESGVQVLRTIPYPQPIFRKLLDLCLSSPRYIDGDTLLDVSTIALLDLSSVVIVRNSDMAVERQMILSVDDIMARNIMVNINMPGNETTVDTIAVFKYPEGTVEYRLNGNTSLMLKNILIGVEYELNIYTGRPYIYNSSIRFILREDMTIDIIRKEYTDLPTKPRCCNLDLGLRYREYNVVLRIVDDFERKQPVAPIDIYIDDMVLKENTYEETYTVRMLYGVHRLEVRPSKDFEDAYITNLTEVFIDRDTEVQIVIKRKTYNIMIKVVDELTNSYPIAPINMTIFKTFYMISPENYVINVTLPYGAYKAAVKPCKGYEKVYGVKEIEMNVPKVKVYMINMSRNMYRVDIRLRDIYSEGLVAPIDLYLNGTLIVSNITEPRIVRSISYGNWTLKVAPSKGYDYVYESHDIELGVYEDTVREVNVPRVNYTITIDLVDVYGKIVSPLSIAMRGPVSTERIVEPPGRTIYLMLPYGSYGIDIQPSNTSIYKSHTMAIEVRSSQNVKIPIQRVEYRLEIKAEDRYIGIVVGRFDVYINGTKKAENMAISTSLDIPYGVYSVQLIPSGTWDRGYEPSKPIVVNVVGDTSITIPVDRKTYALKVVVVEGVNPVRNAIVTIYSMETLTTVTQLITDERGAIETKIPYGSYRIVVSHPDYNIGEIPYITLDNDRSELISISPTPIALIWRYMPVIATLICLGIAVYAVMKIRAILARRLAPEEELF
ncbi:MAG: hypothetical protein QW101_04280 [Ignisphaera sp.]|uniref:Carboxypeptidase regulatory-like domain-containing protein n=1 Tax=Ignisphaera aggregans TaxID=334771 RepID=A0A7J3MY45_9CREN